MKEISNIFRFDEPAPHDFCSPKDYKIQFYQFIRAKLSESQNHKCCYCGIVTTEFYPYPNSATIEHVLPKSNGGTDDLDNLVMACAKCNNEKGGQQGLNFRAKKCDDHVLTYIKHKKHMRTLMQDKSKEADLKKQKERYLVEKNHRTEMEKIVNLAKTVKTNPYEKDTKEWHYFDMCVTFFKDKSVSA